MGENMPSTTEPGTWHGYEKSRESDDDSHLGDDPYSSDGGHPDEGRSRVSTTPTSSINHTRQVRAVASYIRSRRIKDCEKNFTKDPSEAEKQFTREDGVIYTWDSYDWVSLRHMAIDCHLFVYQASPRVFANGSDQMLTPSWQRKMAPTYSRIRIMNDLLWDELSAIPNFGRPGRDHVAPFRCIVPFEDGIRSLLVQREQEFKVLERRHPQHPAVLRKEPSLPGNFAYGLEKNLRGGPLDRAVDNIELARVALDGLRVLVRFLYRHLTDLTRVSRRMRGGRVEGDTPKIPFSDLWYLFQPGQEIIKIHPMPRVYRVLNAVGGRPRLYPGEAETENPQRRLLPEVNDLVVDCFALDYDGKEFGPVGYSFHIEPYEGTRAVTDLPIYPLIFASKDQEDALVERGRKFEELTRPSHREYQGLSLKEGDDFDTVEEVGDHNNIPRLTDAALSFLATRAD